MNEAYSKMGLHEISSEEELKKIDGGKIEGNTSNPAVIARNWLASLYYKIFG